MRQVYQTPGFLANVTVCLGRLSLLGQCACSTITGGCCLPTAASIHFHNPWITLLTLPGSSRRGIVTCATACQSMDKSSPMVAGGQGGGITYLSTTLQSLERGYTEQTVSYCRKVPKKLLLETQPKSTNYHGGRQTHFTRLPGAYDRDVIGDGVLFPDPAFITEQILPEVRKGQAAAFYPIDNNLSMGAIDPPVSNQTMAPVGQSNSEMALISNVLAAYSFITENPERAALYFVSGVCIGLILTLVALVMRISCQTDCKRSTVKKNPRKQENDSDTSDSDDDSDTTSDLSARRHRRFERTLNMNVFTSAEELERAQRLEERERIIREIWMNGQPDIPGTRSLNRYYQDFFCSLNKPGLTMGILYFLRDVDRKCRGSNYL